MVSMMLTILAECATMERENLIDRTKSGLAEAKRNGVHLVGRPFGSTKSAEKILVEYKPVVKYLKSDYSIREIAKLTGVAVNTVLKVKKQLFLTNTN